MAASVAFQMSAFLFLAFVGYVLAASIDQSTVVGGLLVGVVVGPSVLDLVSYTLLIRELAELGAIVLLFAIGMEFNLGQVIKAPYIVIAASGAVIPWAGGYGVAWLYGYGVAESVLVGTALSATSIAITANVLKERALLGEEFARAIIGAAVVDDVLSLFLLSISIQIGAGGVDPTGIGVLAAKAALFLVVGAAGGIGLLNPLLTRLDETDFVGRFPEVLFIAALALAFLYAAVAEYMGLSTIIGAFVAGAALENVRPRRGKSLKEGAEYMHAVFASIFFLSLGVLVDLRALTAPILGLSIVLTLVGLVTKYVGCGVPAYLLGSTPRQASIVGLGMAPRGEVAMIVALLALDAGAITQGLFVALLTMALLTTLATPPLFVPLADREASTRETDLEPDAPHAGVTP